jgi:hypothetical protein
VSGAANMIIGPGGTLAINTSGINTPQLSRLLVNNGSATWTGGSSWYMSDGKFQNNGSFNASPDTSQLSLAHLSGTNAFNNAGTFTKQGSLPTNINVPFHNSGTVDVQAGTLRLNAAGTHTGDFVVTTTLALQGTHNLDSTADVTGTGTLHVGSGTTTFNGPLNNSPDILLSTGTLDFNDTVIAASLDFSGGMLCGTGNLLLDSALTWSNGTMNGTGQTTIAPGSTMAIAVGVV